MNSNWLEIVETLQPFIYQNSIESEYQKEIENCLKILGWKKSNGTMLSQESIPIGNGNSIRIDILLKKNGIPALPIEIKRPQNICNQKQRNQLMSYMRQLKTNVGLYIGENIQLYYDSPDDKNEAISIFNANFNNNDANGISICELLQYTNFEIEKLEIFCKQHYNQIITHNKLKERLNYFLEENNGTKNIINLIKEKFLNEGFEEDTLNQELKNLTIHISWNKQKTTLKSINYKKENKNTETNDNTKFSLDGITYYEKGKHNYGIGKFVWAVIKQFIEDNPNITLEELNKYFPAELCSFKKYNAFIIDKQNISEQDIADDRFFYKEQDTITLNDGRQIIICSQWGNSGHLQKYFKMFIKKAKEYYTIYEE
ncbi:MAG: hypothetical protein IKY67_14900 [Paludibacteraceae bacterium]|nr:hypothetical protein [Paludibacteraceae bacterium]